MPVVFDINETTLDLAPVRSAVEGLVGPEGGFVVWFQKLLQLSMATTATGSYLDFSQLAASALNAVAATSGRSLPQNAMGEIGAAFNELRAYPDVVEGLTTLRDAGWTTIALTNSAPAAVTSQLEQAGLTPLFHDIVSVEVVRTYKPAAAPYRHVAGLLDKQPEQLWMVACHDWDLAGARAVGYNTAFIQRPGMSYASCYEPADISVSDFVALSRQLMT